MRRRVDIAAGLVGRPAVLFLDEPTTGLDPRGRIDIWDLVAGLVREGTTLLLTTQHLEEAERLADTIAVMDHGLIVATGTAEELKHRVGGDVLEVRLGARGAAPAAEAALAPLGIGPARFDGDVLSLPLRLAAGAVVAAVRRLDAAGVEAEDVAVRRPTLDDVFLALTGHAATSEDEGRAAERRVA
jgi:ABC-2 type transport system ATP-binding protein